MWTWSCSALLIALVCVAAPPAVAQEGAVAVDAAVGPDPAVELAIGDLDLQAREAALRTHEARLGLWEEDLTRRARGESDFSDLEGYVTPGDLARAVLFTAVLSVGLAFGTLVFLERRGLLKGRSSAGELRRLEDRVLGGLREFDTLITRLYDRMLSDLARAAPGGAGSGDDRDEAPAEGGSGGRRDGGARHRVLSLAHAGVPVEEIARRCAIGRAEVDFILHMEASH